MASKPGVQNGSRGWQWAAAAVAVIAMIALRDVALWTHPRFWAEEGLRYFEVAYSRPFLEAARNCPQGYYNLGCQAASLLATLVPLEHAPLVTTAFSLIVQALPPLLVLRLARRSSWSPFATVLGVAAVVLAPPLHETWLSSTGCAFYWVLAGALAVLQCEVLALGPITLGIVFTAGLSSPYGFALLPCAAWFALRRRTTERWLVLGALLAALAIETSVIVTTGLPEGRAVTTMPSLALAALIVKCYVLPVAGTAVADDVGIHLLSYIAVDTFWAWSPLVLLPAILLWAAVLRSRNASAIAMLVCGHTMAVFAIVTSLGPKVSLVTGSSLGRYFVCANALNALAAIEALRVGWRSWRGCVLAAFVTATLAHGTWQYFSTDPGITGPDWRTEVRAWRADPSRPIEIWPHGWFLRLPPP